MRTEEWVADHWTSVGVRIADVRRKMARGTVVDEVEVRADIANVLHAAVNLFELEVRRMAGREPSL